MTIPSSTTPTPTSAHRGLPGGTWSIAGPGGPAGPTGPDALDLTRFGYGAMQLGRV